MENVLIAISNYYDLLYLLNIEHIINKNIDVCYLLKYNFSNEDIIELKKMKLGYELRFIENLNEIEYVSDIIISNDNKLIYDKIYNIGKIHNSNIIVINNSEKKSDDFIYFNDTLNILKNKTIVLIAGISNVNIQINFELFLKNKFASNKVEVLSFFSEKVSNGNCLSIEDLLSAYHDDYDANTNIREKVIYNDLIIIGLPYDILNLHKNFSYYYLRLISLINPDCFIMTIMDDYNKKNLKHISYVCKRKIDVIIPMGFKQKMTFNNGVKTLSVYKTKNIRQRISIYNKGFNKVIDCITLPNDIFKINLSNDD